MKTRSDMARRSEIDLAILAAIIPFLMTPTKSIGSCKQAFRKALRARGFFWFEWLTKCAHCSLLRSLALSTGSRLRVNSCLLDDAPPRRLGSPPPQRPSLGIGYSVPFRQHLIGLIRPSRRHIATSPHGPAYMRCLRCAGAPRRPTSGSGLSLSILSRHAALYDPGESRHRHGSVSDAEHSLRQDLNSSALPLILQSVSRRARISGLPDSLTLRPVRFARPPVTDQTRSPRPQRTFTSR